MFVRKICAAVLALAMAGCASPPPPPPALLSMDGRECDDAVNLEAAASLDPQKSKKRYTVTREIGAAAPCINLEDGKKASYALFRLPDFAPSSVIIAGGELEEVRIFAPNVQLLDEAGVPLRGFTREDFLFQGVTYGVQLKPRDGERYILIRAEPDLVGQEYDSVTIGVNTQTICTGYFCMNSYSGVDFESTRQFSYSGKVSVLVQDLRED